MAVSVQDLSIGDEREQVLVHDLTRTQIVQYAGASGDYNPIHTDEIYATLLAGYPSVFAHGMLTMGITGRVLTDWFGDGRLKRFGVRFVRQVWPGARLTAIAVVTDIRSEHDVWVADVDIVTRDSSGADVLVGSASAILDP